MNELKFELNAKCELCKKWKKTTLIADGYFCQPCFERMCNDIVNDVPQLPIPKDCEVCPEYQNMLADKSPKCKNCAVFKQWCERQEAAFND